MILIVKKI